jgi:hypothetical protein
MSPRSNANRPVGSTPKPSRKSPSPSVATLIHSISPNGIRLTLPSSAFRLASRIAPIIPMGRIRALPGYFGAGRQRWHIGCYRRRRLLLWARAGPPTFKQWNGRFRLQRVIADNPRHDSCYYPDSGKWAVRKESPDYIIVQGNETDYYKDEE